MTERLHLNKRGSTLLSREGDALEDPELHQNYRPLETQTKNCLFWHLFEKKKASLVCYYIVVTIIEIITM